MSEFKIVGKIVINNLVMGYKLHSGLSIFYVTPTVLKESELMGIVERRENQVEIIDYDIIKKEIDSLSMTRLKYALKTTTIAKLRAAIETNKNLTTVDIEIMEFGKFVKSFRIDASENTLTLINQQDGFLLKNNYDNLYSLIDFFCSILSRQYVNIENILEYLKEEKGSSIFTCCVYDSGKDISEIRVI